MNYLSEAFKKLDILEEDNFSLDSTSDIDDMSHFLSIDRDPVQDVIDPEAQDEEELEDTYIGKVILHCPVCNSMIYKDVEDIEKDDEEDLVNVGEECPYCYTCEGFKVIGIVSPFQEKPEEDVEAEVEISDKDEADENGEGSDEVEVEDEVVEESLDEDFEHVEVSTDEQKLTMDADEEGKITIESEPIANEADVDEFIQPVPELVQDEIEVSAEEEAPAEEAPEEVPEEEEIDYDIDDFDEESFDGLGESYLKKVYENVNSYKTTNVNMKDNSLIVEGVIRFNSGKTKKTSFVFEAKTATKNNKLRFIGENKQITRGRKAFTLTGTLNENKSFITEKFNYNYMAKNAEGKSKRLYGTLKK